jgi:hypothetical protein
MGLAEVRITAIRNRTKKTITIPHQQRGPIAIEPGGTLEGPFIYQYDPEKEGTIPSPNEVWFVDSPHEFKWGSFAFSNPDA